MSFEFVVLCVIVETCDHTAFEMAYVTLVVVVVVVAEHR